LAVVRVGEGLELQARHGGREVDDDHEHDLGAGVGHEQQADAGDEHQADLLNHLVEVVAGTVVLSGVNVSVRGGKEEAYIVKGEGGSNMVSRPSSFFGLAAAPWSSGKKMQLSRIDPPCASNDSPRTQGEENTVSPQTGT
jgi:hypothetical protein